MKDEIAEIKAILRSYPCHLCAGWSEHLHHVKTRGAGGKDFENLLPVCVLCHDKIHVTGKKTCEALFRMNFASEAKRLWRRVAESKSAR